MASVDQMVRNALLNGVNGYIGHSTNNPFSGDSQPQYYSNVTRAFYQDRLQYTSNMVTAQVQGINYDDFYAFKPLRIRTAMVIDPTTGNNLGSDWQRIIAENTNIDFLPRGAKVVFNGSTWLVTNPQNVESVTGTSVIRRCNAVWHYLDEYGNVQGEPFCYGNGAGDMATTNDVKENMILATAYQHSVMQLNPQTSVLAHNRRMILGSQAFAVHAVQDFVLEFTEDEGSTHIQYFDLYRTEPLQIDDMENKVADGKSFSWEITVSPLGELSPGATVQLVATSTVNGNEPTVPYSYNWSVDNAEVATVDENGVLKAVAAGEANVVCELAQNPSIKSVSRILVGDGVSDGLTWLTAPPESIERYKTATFEAAYNDESVEYTYDGPPAACFAANQNGNSVEITCWQPSDIPLVVTATCNGSTISAKIRLEGW